MKKMGRSQMLDKIHLYTVRTLIGITVVGCATLGFQIYNYYKCKFSKCYDYIQKTRREGGRERQRERERERERDPRQNSLLRIFASYID